MAKICFSSIVNIRLGPELENLLLLTVQLILLSDIFYFINPANLSCQICPKSKIAKKLR